VVEETRFPEYEKFTSFFKSIWRGMSIRVERVDGGDLVESDTMEIGAIDLDVDKNYL
jgi:hypothetical protein